MSKPPSSEPSTDEHVAALRRVLVPLHQNPMQAEPEVVEQALRLAARAKTQMGTGIDPAVVAACADDFAQALKLDPSCVAAYQGLVRGAQALASARPSEAEGLLSHALRWLRVAMVRVASLKTDPAMAELEGRIQTSRIKARERPRASGPSVRVQVRRDAEGRVLRSPTARRENPRFRPDSEELAALVPELFQGVGEIGPEVPRWAAPTVGLLFLTITAVAGVYELQPILVGALASISILLIGLPVLVAIGRRTRGWAPMFITVALVSTTMTATDRILTPLPLAERIVQRRFGPEVDQVYVDLRHRLRIASVVKGSVLRLQKLALVEETGKPLQPLRVSVLHPRLPKTLRSDPGETVASVAVLRRYQSPVGPLLAVWIIDPSRNMVLTQATFSHDALPALEQAAVSWLEGFGPAPPPQ